MLLSSLNKTKATIARQSCLLLQRPRCWSFSTTADDDFKFGTVKMFNRKKAYGFILPDDREDAKELFVHNSGIVGTERVDSALFPFLRQGERVRYTVTTGENAKTSASQVTYDDGSKVPIYRKEYVETIKKYEFGIFGGKVNAILTDDDNENKLESILEEHANACAAVAVGQERYDYFNEHGSFEVDAADPSDDAVSNDEEASSETADEAAPPSDEEAASETADADETSSEEEASGEEEEPKL